MATKRKYAYYLKGNKIALIQREDALAGSSNDEYGMYKSPTESIADGLEIQYTYSPRYFIETTNDVDTNITQYQSTDGKLSIADNSSAYINYATAYALATDKYIVLKKAGRFNGLHKIHSLSNNTGTNNKITLTTKYSGSESAWTDFEEAPELYYAVNALEDESFELDLNRYQANAVVYYLKARMAESAGNMEIREFFMREFKKQLEKGRSAFKRGPYIAQGFKQMR